MAQDYPKLESSKKWQRIHQFITTVLKQGIKTTHNRIITCGLLVSLIYGFSWLRILWQLTLTGSSMTLLNLGFLYLGSESLWKQRHSLASSTVFEDERLIGYLLILGGVATFPFCYASTSLQMVIGSIILAGIAMSNWGTRFFTNHLLPVSLIITSLYPDLGFLSNTVRMWLSQDQLERSMAWLGGLALQAIGQPITIQGTIISLSQGIRLDKAVEVGAGCSGFDMACTMAGIGLILGLFFKQSPARIVLLIAIGIFLSLLLNIPRIVLLAFAVVYWGKAAFEFWHGPIGGQIFSGILLTGYYYIVMALLNKPFPKQKEL
jgi:exosortase/archaeosortase family protein